ncbi:MAG: citrate/2-methylcitrate synthase, partial [Limnochordales bacterium]
MSTFKAGLEDIVALRSEICFIDGQKRQLVYRGYDISELVGKATFEEVVYLLWNGQLPAAAELERFKEQLAAEAALPEQLVDFLKASPKDAEPMAVLRTAVSALGLFDPDTSVQDREANRRKAARLLAKVPVIVAYNGRLREGKDPVPPKPELGLAANFLYMLHGREPDRMDAEIFDAALILHADHELNASTFTARVVTSTLSDGYSAVTAAIAALRKNERSAAAMLALTDQGWLLILILIAILLLVGTFLEPAAALIILTPVLLPLARQLGLDIIQFGVLLVLGLVIGLVTPPVGTCLFIVASISRLRLETVARALVPFIAACVVVL